MPTLVLVRHAKAEAPHGNLADHDRALALEGRGAATHLGTTLAQAGIEPNLVLVSSANRTVQTWKLMAPELAATTVEIEPDLYETSPGRIQARLSELPDTDEVVMIVGHEPTMSSTAAWLAGEGSDKTALQKIAQGLRTGCAAVVAVPSWSQLERSSGILVAIHSSHTQY